LAKKKAVETAGPTPHDQLLLDAARFGRLFEGNTRSSGRFDPFKERMFTEYTGAKQEDFEAHLSGKMGVGVVPICDDDTCLWAAIDLDNDSDEDLPIDEIADRIAELKIPLVACRSKSGGVHCYLFLEKPQPCNKIRTYMTQWAAALGWKVDCVFPKQSRLVNNQEGERNLGNWINLPYMGGDKTNRYARVGHKTLSLAEFLNYAEKHRVTDHDLRSLSASEHPDAPPCIQKIYTQGVAQGHRNEALYNVVVYLKKAFPNDVQPKAIEANTSIFSKPLGRTEFQRTVNSASRPDCNYRCNEDPVRSLCDRDACVTRKHGITSGDLERLNTVDALPTFSDLVKFMTEPVRWQFKINGVSIGNVKTMQLLDWRTMREIIAERLTFVPPMIKPQEWERILQPLMKTCRIEEVPDDASVSGVIRDRLREFAARTDLTSRGEDTADRKALLRGLPAVAVVNGMRCVVFRGQDFVNYLKRNKSEELKGVDLWFAVKNIGTFSTKLRIPDVKQNGNINVWCVPVEEVLANHELSASSPEFRSDL
jgi:hypothetical protein